MRAKSCLVLLVGIVSPGCFRFHGADADDDFVAAATADAGPTLRDFGAPPRVDAAPSACRPVGAVVQSCVSGDPSAFIEPGYLLVVDDCHCGGELRCDVLEADDGAVNLEVNVCGEGRCRACTGPTEVFCPVFSRGPHTILRSGVPHFAMGDAPGDGTLCQTVGPASAPCDFPGSPGAEVREVCLGEEPTEPGVRLAVALRIELSCGQELGPCDAALDNRTGEITVTPRVSVCSEGRPTPDCAESSRIVDQVCTTPPLWGREDGYRLKLGDEVITEFRVGDEAPGCIALEP